MKITLTCPNCSTRYFAPDKLLDEATSFVECGQCNHVWYAPIDIDPAKLTDRVAGLTDHIEPYRNFRLTRKIRFHRFLRFGMAGIWVAAFALFIALISVFTFYRFELVQLWPAARTIYGLAGVHVDPFGFRIGELTANHHLSTEGQTLTVSGKVTNITQKTRAVTPVLIEISDEFGVVYETILAYPQPEQVKPGAEAEFSAAIPAPSVENIIVSANFLDQETRAENRGDVNEE